MTMKPILARPESMEIYFENFNQLGEAILKSGGNSFAILKRFDKFLRILAENKISITAKYDLPRPSYEQQNMTEEYDDTLRYVSYYRSKDKVIFTRMIGTNRFRSNHVNEYQIEEYTANEIKDCVNRGLMVGCSKTYHGKPYLPHFDHSPMWQKPLSTSNPILCTSEKQK